MAGERSDIVLNGMTLKLFRPNQNRQARGIHGTDQPQLASDQFIDEDLPVAVETWHLGAGYTQRIVDGTYSYAANGDGRFPRLFCPGPQTNLITLTSATDSARWACDVASDTYFGGGRFAYRAVNGSATSPLAADNDLGAGNVGYSAQNAFGDAYIGTDASGTPSTLWKITKAHAWSSSTAKRRQLTTALYNSVNGFRMFGMTDTAGLNTIKTVLVDNSVDPLTDGNWGTPITIGDYGGVTINDLTALQDHVYVGSDRGLWDFDGSTGLAFNLTPWMAQRHNSENGIAATVGNQWVTYGHKWGLLRYQAQGVDTGIVQDVSFGHGTPNETPIRGQVTATCMDQGWTVQAIYNGTDTYICWGRDKGFYEYGFDQSGNQQLAFGVGSSNMLWHGGLIKLAGAKCYLLFISGQTDPPKLWFGNGANVGWCYLARTENPLQDSEYRFATSYSLWMPYEHWGRPTTPKNLVELDVEGENLGVGASIAVSYSVDGQPYASLGTANGNPWTQLLPGTEIIGRRIGLEYDGTNTNTAGANLRGTLLLAAERVRVRHLKEYQVLLSWDSSDRYSGRNMSRPAKTLAALQALTTAGAVTLRDEFGQTLTVLVKPPVNVVEYRSDGNTDKEQPEPILVATVRCSILKRLTSTFAWNDGTVFDGTKNFG